MAAGAQACQQMCRVLQTVATGYGKRRATQQCGASRGRIAGGFAPIASQCGQLTADRLLKFSRKGA
jgi:hypothetical protein